MRYFTWKLGLVSNNLWVIENYCWTLSWQRPLSYRNHSIDLQSKLMDWFLYDNGLCHERGKFEKRLSFVLQGFLLKFCIFLLNHYCFLFAFSMFWVHKLLHNWCLLSPLRFTIERRIKRCLRNLLDQKKKLIRGRSRATITSKMELFVTIVKGLS